MMRFPPDTLTLSEAAQQYGLKLNTLHIYIRKGRLEGFRRGSRWYTTDRAMKKYLRSRDKEKIPKRYRKRT